ncbi:MAG: DUF1559 domain-containing protein [Verrucomicrobiae bacterium]|nr:DUF1559 domain-containing protein [Verrucomicrobiae bacterium]
MTISILALLAALLLPGLRAAKDAARKTQCASNLRQLGLAMAMYLDDHARFFSYADNVPGGRLWYFGLETPFQPNAAPAARHLDLTQGRLWSYFRNLHGIEVCPSYDYRSPLWRQKFATVTYGYGMNLEIFGVAASEVRDPARTVLMADAANVNTIQAPASSQKPMLEEFYYIHNFGNQAPTTHFRHNGKANVLFCDGHVESFAMAANTGDIRLPSARVGRLSPANDRALFTP